MEPLILLLIVVSPLACLGYFGNSSAFINPQLFLFATRDSTSSKKFTGITESVSDLMAKQYDMDDQSLSYSLRGIAILYEYRNYNQDFPNGRFITLSHTLSTWNTGTHPQLKLTSSVKIIGYNFVGTRPSSVTLFAHKNFRGLCAEHILTNKETLLTSDSASLVIVGKSDWTFYDEINYLGRGDCLYGNTDQHTVRFLKNSSAVGFPINKKRSVKQHCYGLPTVAYL